jgi:predicted extracellular nuclease
MLANFLQHLGLHARRSYLFAACTLALLGAAAPAGAAVQISQIYGGGGNAGGLFNADFVELRNTGTTAVSLQGWSLQYASAAGSTWNGAQLTQLSGSIPASGYFLIKLGTGANVGQPSLPTPDVTGTTAVSATAGKVALVNNTVALTGTCPLPNAAIVDFVGFGTTANCSEGNVPTAAPSNSTAVLRAADGCTDTNVNGSDFSTGVPVPRNSASAAAVCGGGGGGGGGQPLDLAIYTIQGSGSQSALVGTLARTSGVVTKQVNNGFFMQDLTGDGDPATSDGIFVFTSNATFSAVAPGNLVQVTGTVVEFNTGAASNAHTQARRVTELSNITSVGLLGTGLSITPAVVTLPEAVEDELERYEGMLVTLTGPLTVTQNFFQGRFGQLTLSVGGRLETPTNRFRPGPQALALADENARRRIILDDGSSLQNPNPTPYLGAGAVPRAGDVVSGSLTGVIDFGLATSSNAGPGDYKIHPTVAPVFATGNSRSSAPEAVGGNVKVASFNVLNYFTTFTNGSNVAGQTGQGCSLGSSVSAGNCRGADNLNEFLRQRAKIVEAMAAIDADALGLMEIQNNGNTAVQNLVDALNARIGAPLYAPVALPTQGTGTDAIRSAMIYKPSRMRALGAPISDTDPVNNRPTLAQGFIMANGERFSLVVNHLKSKGSCPSVGDADFDGNNDVGDGQGCWNLLRLQQAQRLRTFVAQVQAATASNDALLVGDFNAYAQEDPIFDLTSSGYVDQIGRFNGFGYSFVFDGAAGRLDHAITTATLSPRVTRAIDWHINADETSLQDYNTEFKAPLTTCGGVCPADPYTTAPWRASDHDPVVVGLSIYKTITAGLTSTAVAGTAGDDIIFSGAGRRSLAGGGGNDWLVFTAGFAGGATITDLSAGDVVDLRAVLKNMGITSTDPVTQGYLKCNATGADALISIDPDATGPALQRAMLLLKNQACSLLSTTTFVQ